MNDLNWAGLFKEVTSTDIQRASGGLVTKQMANWWRNNGLPRLEHAGVHDYSRFIIKAAQTKGITVTKEQILQLSARFKVTR